MNTTQALKLAAEGLRNAERVIASKYAPLPEDSDIQKDLKLLMEPMRRMYAEAAEHLEGVLEGKLDVSLNGTPDVAETSEPKHVIVNPELSVRNQLLHGMGCALDAIADKSVGSKTALLEELATLADAYQKLK